MSMRTALIAQDADIQKLKTVSGHIPTIGPTARVMGPSPRAGNMRIALCLPLRNTDQLDQYLKRTLQS